MKPLTKQEFLEKLKNDSKFNKKYGRKPAKNKMALPPCHIMCQFRVINNKLSCMLIMRSNDVGLGTPFNIASYALLTHILARECNLEVGDLVYTIGDAHIYVNHIEQLKKQIENEPFVLPKLIIDETFKLSNEFDLDSCSKFKLENYYHHDTIKMEMVV